MAADNYGNDITSVAIPVTGAIAFAPFGTAVPTPIEGANRDFQLPAAFQKIGLISEDGGPEWEMEPDGDAITFWQDGYSIPTGLATCTITFKAAQTDETVRSIIRGKTADSNGYMTIDAGGNIARYVVYTEEIFKNRTIRRRVSANATIESVKEDQSTRGEVLGYEVTVTVATSPELDNEHLGEWLIPAA